MDSFYNAAPLLADAEALRRRADDDGYLFLSGLLDREKVLALRRRVVDIMAEAGWLEAGADPMDAVTTREPMIEGISDEYMAAYDRVQKQQAFHELAHDEAILGALEAVFGEAALPHALKIGRMMFPGAPATPPHQDFIHIQGTPDTWTSWIPLGDVPAELGGLAVLAGSHKAGLAPVVPMSGAGGRGIEGDHLQGRWVAGPFACGDVIMFHSHTSHKSLPNTTGSRMRLSVDYRYQPMSHPICEYSLKPHFRRLTWDEIYDGWPNGPLKYYWQQHELDVQPIDMKVHERGGY